MDISTFTLFMAFLVFAAFSGYSNTKVTLTLWLKRLTLFLMLAGLAGAGYLLLVSLVKHAAG